jgi:hypothetical protein
VQYPFGYGSQLFHLQLFRLELDKKEIKQDGALTVSVTVTNYRENSKAKSRCFFYVSDLFASIPPGKTPARI